MQLFKLPLESEGFELYSFQKPRISCKFSCSSIFLCSSKFCLSFLDFTYLSLYWALESCERGLKILNGKYLSLQSSFLIVHQLIPSNMKLPYSFNAHSKGAKKLLQSDGADSRMTENPTNMLYNVVQCPPRTLELMGIKKMCVQQLSCFHLHTSTRLSKSLHSVLDEFSINRRTVLLEWTDDSCGILSP